MSTENEEMTKYTVSFTVTKNFDIEVVFEAPSAEAAAEICDEIVQEADENFLDELKDECVDEYLEDVGLLKPPVPAKWQTVEVNRVMQAWCDDWLQEHQEEENEENAT